MRNLRLASWGLLIQMLLNANTVSAQVMQGIPRSPIETMSGSTDRMPEGWYVMPWVATGVVYDDQCVFHASGPGTGGRVPPRDARPAGQLSIDACDSDRQLPVRFGGL